MWRLIRESEVIATTRLIHSTNKTPSSNTAPDTIHPHISAGHRRTQLRGGLRRMRADIRTTPGLGSYLLLSGTRVSDQALAFAKWSGLPTAEITSRPEVVSAGDDAKLTMENPSLFESPTHHFARRQWRAAYAVARGISPT